jgi:uncharacterized protein
VNRVNRRAFLYGLAATMGGVVVGGGLPTPRLASAKADLVSLGPVEDLRDGVVRLWLPPGFQYRSFHDTSGTPIVLDDGTILPGRHDGMAAFPGPGGNTWLVRNHEINNPGTPFGPAVPAPYDAMAQGGTTTSLVTSRGEVLESFTSLNGTQMNCSGGPMPWGSWMTCEETVNGPDVGPDFTGTSNVTLLQPHGFIFEVPAGGKSSREPITSAGRFAHEAAVFSPKDGILYLTEDNFEFPSGFYRYIPPSNPMKVGVLENRGKLQMLRVVGIPNAHLEATQQLGAQYLVDWVDIDDPNPTFPHTPGAEAPTSNDDALNYVGNQGRALGAAGFSRLEGAAYVKGEIFFTSTQGGGAPETGPEPDAGYGNGAGQVWSYDPKTSILTCRYQSPGADDLHLPDNITARSERGSIVICEDGFDDNLIRGLSRDGRLFDLALNRMAGRFNDEFAGATFGPAGNTLFVNIQASRGISFAIWGPWARLGA